MHGSYDTDLTGASRADDLIEIDRAMRTAREAAFKAGSLSDSLWSLLLAIAAHDDGLSFNQIAEGAAQSLGRSTLMRCLALLEERGLITGSIQGPAALLTHVSAAAKGRLLIGSVLADAQSRLRASQG
jgi:hypothetical protein